MNDAEYQELQSRINADIARVQKIYAAKRAKKAATKQNNVEAATKAEPLVG